MLTNLVLLASSLTTNSQTAVVGRTNNAALISHVEQVQQVEVTGWRSGRRILSRRTNVFNLPPRRWSEVVPDLTPAQATPATVQPAPVPTVTQTVPAVQQQAVVAPPPPRPAPNTNNPAFRRRAEMEARRAAAQATRTNAAPPATSAPAAPAAQAARTNTPALK